MSPDNVHIEYRVYGQRRSGGDTRARLGVRCELLATRSSRRSSRATPWWRSTSPATAPPAPTAPTGRSPTTRRTSPRWRAQIPNAQLVLVGHSMGGDVALAAAPLIGARVIGVIAVDALRSVGLPPLPATRDRAAHRAVPRRLRRARRASSSATRCSRAVPTRRWCRRSPTTCRSSRRRSAIPSMQLAAVDGPGGRPARRFTCRCSRSTPT